MLSAEKRSPSTTTPSTAERDPPFDTPPEPKRARAVCANEPRATYALVRPLSVWQACGRTGWVTVDHAVGEAMPRTVEAAMCSDVASPALGTPTAPWLPAGAEGVRRADLRAAFRWEVSQALKLHSNLTGASRPSRGQASKHTCARNYADVFSLAELRAAARPFYPPPQQMLDVLEQALGDLPVNAVALILHKAKLAPKTADGACMRLPDVAAALSDLCLDVSVDRSGVLVVHLPARPHERGTKVNATCMAIMRGWAGELDLGHFELSRMWWEGRIAHWRTFPSKPDRPNPYAVLAHRMRLDLFGAILAVEARANQAQVERWLNLPSVDPTKDHAVEIMVKVISQSESRGWGSETVRNAGVLTVPHDFPASELESELCGLHEELRAELSGWSYLTITLGHQPRGTSREPFESVVDLADDVADFAAKPQYFDCTNDAYTQSTAAPDFGANKLTCVRARLSGMNFDECIGCGSSWGSDTEAPAGFGRRDLKPVGGLAKLVSSLVRELLAQGADSADDVELTRSRLWAACDDDPDRRNVTLSTKRDCALIDILPSPAERLPPLAAMKVPDSAACRPVPRARVDFSKSSDEIELFILRRVPRTHLVSGRYAVFRRKDTEPRYVFV